MARSRKEFSDMTNSYVDDRASVLIQEFYTLAVAASAFKGTKALNFREKGDYRQGIDGWRALAVREANGLKDRYRKPEIPELEQNYEVCLTQITKLIRKLNQLSKTELPDEAYSVKVQNIIKSFRGGLSLLFAEDTAKKNIDYKERLEVRSEIGTLIDCDPYPFIAKAKEILKQVADRPERLDVNWRDVSCALALVTGRRQSEIHSSAQFTVKSENEIIFEGQLKGKLRRCFVDDKGFYLNEAPKNASAKTDSKNSSVAVVPAIKAKFVIPTLVDADLVVAGLEYLESNDRRIHGDDEIEMNDLVNKRWNKPLG
jgi:hypothetical protein